MSIAEREEHPGMNAFDGEAISRADREFLAHLDDHLLQSNPHYGAPPPSIPDYNAKSERRDRRRECFEKALQWMLANYAFYPGASKGKGGVISLVNGETYSLASLRTYMQRYALQVEGPRGGVKIHSVVDSWAAHRELMCIDKVQSRPDKLRPMFEEDRQTILNRYRPPVHPQSGGEIDTFLTFFQRLFPDEKECDWFWDYLAHKARRPWVPMIGVIMVAEEFGTGRGTLFEILGQVFGEDYVAPCTFGELTGQAAGARFNARLADALFAVVNEAVTEDGEHQSQRRLAYDALKNVIEPSPAARKRFEEKGERVYAQRSAMTPIVATNHRDVVKLPPQDRRLSVLTCGRKMTQEEREAIQAWKAKPENIGALYRALLETPAAPIEVFDPYDNPPPFAGRLEMVGMGKSRLEDAYEAAIDALEGCPLFTMTQALRLVSYFNDARAGEGSDKIKFAVAKRAYRLRERDDAGNRIMYRKRREIIYATTKDEQRRWRSADTKLVAAALDRAEARVTKVINAERDGLADLASGG